MAKYKEGLLANQRIEVPGNDNLYLEVEYKIKVCDAKEPWDHDEDVTHDVTLWMTVKNLKCDELQIKIESEKLYDEFKTIIDKRLDDKIDSIRFDELFDEGD